MALLGGGPLEAQGWTPDARPAHLRPPASSLQPPLCPPALTALVLGGGGAKGMAHLGVLAVLDSLGITPDLIVGTSAGAVLGAMWASGESAASIETRVRAARLDRIVRPYSPSLGATFASARPLFVWERAGARWVVQDGAVRDDEADSALVQLLAHAETHARGDFDALPIPFRAVATDLRTREMVVLDRGRLIDAVRASMAIPVLLRPVPRDGRTLVDGGLSANNPVAVARALGATRVIVATIASPVPDMSRLDDPLTVASAVFEFLFIQDPMQLGAADVRIALPTAPYGMLDFRPATLDTLVALGRATATAALASRCVHPLTPTPSREAFPVTTTLAKGPSGAPMVERIGLAVAYDHALSAQAWSAWSAPAMGRWGPRSVELTVAPWALRVYGIAHARRAGASLDLRTQRLPTFTDRRLFGAVQVDDALFTIGVPREAKAGWHVDGGLVGWAGRTAGVDGRTDAGVSFALARRRTRDPVPAFLVEGVTVRRWRQLTLEARPHGAIGIVQLDGHLLASVGNGVPVARRQTLGGLEGFAGRPLLSARGDHIASLALRAAWPLRPGLHAEIEPMIGRVGDGGFGSGSDPSHGRLHRGFRVGLAIDTPLGTFRVSEGFAADGGRAAYVRFGDWR